MALGFDGLGDARIFIDRTAYADLAPVIDENVMSPPALGTGGFDVTVAGVQHLSSAAESLTEVVDDGSGNTYLVVSAWTIDVDPVSLL